MDPTVEARFTGIEGRLVDSAQKLDGFSDSLKAIRDTLNLLAQGHEPQPTIPDPISDEEDFILPNSNPTSTAVPSTSGRASDRLRPNRPPNFDGERVNGRAFINACR